MESKDLKQGTAEWRAARVGKVTGSIIGAVLGVSPFTSRKQALRRMVREAMGDMESFSNEAMQWGNDHEDEACKLYTAMYAGSAEVTETGFWTKGDMGASPDRLVGTDGLLEVKCPYSLRRDTSPHFKGIHELPHYWQQIQMQLYITGRQWCDFLQWTPHDHYYHRVERDPKWLENNLDEIASFMEDYESMTTQMAEGGAEERLALSEGWESAMTKYAAVCAEEALLKARKDDAKQAIVDLMEASKLQHCESELGTCQKVKRKGAVDWEAIAYSLGEAEDVKDKTTDPVNRKKGSESWTINVKKGDK